MGENIQFIQTTPEALVDRMVSEVKELLLETKPQPIATVESEIVFRKDAAKLFGVSLVTIHDWSKKGILTPYKMGNKTYYKRSELLETLYSSNRKGGTNE